MGKIFLNPEGDAVFGEDSIVAVFLHEIQAIEGPTAGNVSVLNLVKTAAPPGEGLSSAPPYYIIYDRPFTEFVDAADVAYGSDAAETAAALNGIFTNNAPPHLLAPVISSSATINLTEGKGLNYTLEATDVQAYSWDNLPAGVVQVRNKDQGLIGGFGLTAAGSPYNFTGAATNNVGRSELAITLNVTSGGFQNSLSLEFNNNEYSDATAATLQNTLGRSGNGSGASDAWTLAFYFKAGTSNNSAQTIFYYGGDTYASESAIRIRYNGSNSAEFIRLRYGSETDYLDFQTAPGTITAGVWNFIQISYDGGTTGNSPGSINDYYSRFTIRINGVVATTTNTNSGNGITAGLTGDLMRWGQSDNGEFMRFGCRLDEFAIWDSDQDANAATIYNGGAPHDLSALGTPPTHWYRFGDGDTFPTLTDSGSGTAANGTMRNMTTGNFVTDTP